MGTDDVHIGLFKFPLRTDGKANFRQTEFYEFVLGGYGNTETVIRRYPMDTQEIIDKVSAPGQMFCD